VGTNEGIVNRLRELLAGITGQDPDSIDDHLPLLRGGLELDSLTIASFMTAVEDEFGVDILEEDLALDSLESLSALSKYLAEGS
jgi:acyl carrier protein